MPRTWHVSEMTDRGMGGLISDGKLRGTFILKVPDVELGGGIHVVDLSNSTDREKVVNCGLTESSWIDGDGVRWGKEEKEGSCVLQRYVDPPLLMKPYEGSERKKVSKGRGAKNEHVVITSHD